VRSFTFLISTAAGSIHAQWKKKTYRAQRQLLPTPPNSANRFEQINAQYEKQVEPYILRKRKC
jgi:hypothetical protein